MFCVLFKFCQTRKTKTIKLVLRECQKKLFWDESYCLSSWATATAAIAMILGGFTIYPSSFILLPSTCEAQ